MGPIITPAAARQTRAAVLQQFAVAHPLDVLAHQLDVVVAVITGRLQRGDDLPQRQDPLAQPLARLFDRGRLATIAQMDDGDVRGDAGDFVQHARIVPQMIGIEGQLQVRMRHGVQERHRLVERRQKGPIRGAGRVHRLDGQRDVQLHGQRQQFSQRAANNRRAWLCVWLLRPPL